jgi:hypothetical protein
MRRGFRTVLIGLGLAAAAHSAHQGKYWICKNPSHKTATQDRLESRCIASSQATAEAEEHRKIHPNDVVVFDCVM